MNFSLGQFLLALNLRDQQSISTLLSKHPELTIPAGALLRDASAYGQLQIVKLLLDAGVDPDVQDKAGFTSLMLASYYGHFDCVDLLLKQACHIDLQANNGWTAFLAAHSGEHFEIAQYLKQHGANQIDLRQTWLNQQFIFFLNCLHEFYPQDYSHLDITEIQSEILLGLCHGYSLLWIMKTSNSAYHRMLIALSEWDREKNHLKSSSILQNFFQEIIATLLVLQDYTRLLANPLAYEKLMNLVDSKGNWQIPCRIGFVFKTDELAELVSIMQATGLSFEVYSLGHAMAMDTTDYLESKSIDGPSTLHNKDIDKLIEEKLFAESQILGVAMLACARGSYHVNDFEKLKSDFLNKIIQQRINNQELDLVDRYGANALYYAVLARDITLCDRLLDAGINICGDDGFFPFTLAARSGNLHLLQRYLALGGDINYTRNNKSLLYYATLENQTEIIHFLLNHGAKVHDVKPNKSAFFQPADASTQIVCSKPHSLTCL